MNDHKNARTTPHSRALMARRVVAEGRAVFAGGFRGIMEEVASERGRDGVHTVSGTMSMAPQGHSAAQMPQPLQKS